MAAKYIVQRRMASWDPAMRGGRQYLQFTAWQTITTYADLAEAEAHIDGRPVSDMSEMRIVFKGKRVG